VTDFHIEQFQRWLEETYAGDERFSGRRRASGAEADAGVRLEVGEGSYYEILVRLAKPDIRVGFLTTDRSLNESIEQGILDSGDSLDELMEVELDDLGEAPVVMEHFFERPAFCYVTSLPLTTPDVLGRVELRRRIERVLDACCALFQEYLEE
jgi:hypothetical protein